MNADESVAETLERYGLRFDGANSSPMPNLMRSSIGCWCAPAAKPV
jgi:hypothetical protein